jgi:hypothetical protein
MTNPTIKRLARAAYDRLASSDDCWVEGCEPFIDLSSVTVDGNVNLIELARAVLMARAGCAVPEIAAITAWL